MTSEIITGLVVQLIVLRAERDAILSIFGNDVQMDRKWILNAQILSIEQTVREHQQQNAEALRASPIDIEVYGPHNDMDNELE